MVNPYSRLTARIALSAHARGMVLVSVSARDVALIARHTASELKAMGVRGAYCAQLKTELGKMVAWSAPTVPAPYARARLLQNPAAPPRRDTVIYIAYQTRVRAGTLSDAAVAVVALAPAVADERDFSSAALSTALHAGRVLEVEFVASKKNVDVGDAAAARGTATLLLAYALAKQFARVARGAPKFAAATMDLAAYGDGVPPLRGVATRLGFVAAGVERDDEDDHEDVVLSGALTKLEAALPATPLTKLCAVAPHSGIPRCN